MLFRVIPKRDVSTISSDMRHLTVAQAELAASAVLILTAQILETFSGIFSEISLADAEVLPVQEADP